MNLGLFLLMERLSKSPKDSLMDRALSKRLPALELG
jgi:hypothetical protein